jgi:transposase
MEAKRNTSKRYPPEVKERAVRLVLEARAEDPKDAAAIGRIARHLGVGAESLRQWVKQAEIEAGKRGGLTSAERDELAGLPKGLKELRRSNSILRSASAFFDLVGIR